jgi:hypothetical protein
VKHDQDELVKPSEEHPDTRSRRNAIVPTENTLFADPKTGRIESAPVSPRPSDTMVTALEANVVEETTRRGSDYPNNGSAPPTPRSRKQVILCESGFTNLQSPGVASDSDCAGSLIYVTKSSTVSANGSPTPRRNSLGRILNPLQSINSRIHPITGYAPTPRIDTDSTVEVPPNAPNEFVSGDSKNAATVLATQTVQITEMNPVAHSRTNFRTQRAVYRMTQASLAGYFDTHTESRYGRLVLRIIFVSIIVNVAALAFETCDGQNRGSSAPGYPYLPGESVYKAIDAFFSCVYSLEFVGRTIARKHKRDMLSDPLTWIDFVSLTPWYLQLFLKLAGKDFNLDAADGISHKMGLLRLLRVLRLGYILRHYESMKILVVSLNASVPPLMITMFFLFTLVMLLGTAIFYAEPCYNFNTCPFTDIFNSAYFIMVT